MLKHPHYRVLFLALLALVCLLTMGAWQARQDFLTRGIDAPMPAPMRGAGVQLGVVVDLNQYNEGELVNELQRMKNAGITHLRHTFYATPDHDWAQTTTLVHLVHQQGMTLVPLLDGDPSTHFMPPTNIQAFAQWAGEFAQRYGDLLDAYIIWDEPNITDHWGNQPINANEYAALLSATAHAIRQADAIALIVAAPLAPTTENNAYNLADPLYLQQLYEVGAGDSFDVVAGKPYGFNTAPQDRTVDLDALNFSRIILLREVMLANGDEQKAVWAGNWGWHSLPASWSGDDSIWGQTDEQTRAEWTIDALNRARTEWAWMGVMFLENWQPHVPATDPHIGFTVKDTATERLLQTAWQPTLESDFAGTGFYLARDDDPAQQFTGGWRFSPEFGADISQSGDKATFQFYGTDVALRVRRADYRARFYVTIDGQPVNALPRGDDNRTMLILTAADPAEDYITNELVATNLPLGKHTLELEAYRGWQQWALQGFSVATRPNTQTYQWGLVNLAGLTLLLLGLAIQQTRRIDWATDLPKLYQWWQQISTIHQLLLTSVSAIAVTMAGFLTWNTWVAGIYRRLDDLPHLALTATAASVFYFAPSFILYLIAATILFILLALRPARGAALVAVALPFYLTPKPMLGYRFSPVEIFIVIAFAAFAAHWLITTIQQTSLPRPKLCLPDLAVLMLTLVATLSLLTTKRLDVATNEWRVLILEPALFYWLIRGTHMTRPDKWLVWDAYIAGGVLVALIGLGQLIMGDNLITAELGIQRLRSIYGSPNNVALYLGRMIPILLAMTLLGQNNGKRHTAYLIALIPIGLATILTLSKGWLFIGMPASSLVIFLLWQRQHGGKAWRWLLGVGVTGIILLWIARQIPALAARLNPQSDTSFLRLNLWRASLNMALDHPWLGVGLDNFLYEYRGRYMLDVAWKEPHLNHPHNIILDFATRLGGLGLLAGIFLFGSFARVLQSLYKKTYPEWLPIVAGMTGSFTYLLAHGLVDHSFFLVDLAGSFYLFLAMSKHLETSSK